MKDKKYVLSFCGSAEHAAAFTAMTPDELRASPSPGLPDAAISRLVSILVIAIGARYL